MDLMFGDRLTPMEDRISILSPITFSQTSENNTCFYGFFLIRVFASTHFPIHTHGGTSIIPRLSAKRQTDSRSVEETVERWSFCTPNNEARRKSTC